VGYFAFFGFSAMVPDIYFMALQAGHLFHSYFCHIILAGILSFFSMTALIFESKKYAMT
jgi:hypothetical protein